MYRIVSIGVAAVLAAAPAAFAQQNGESPVTGDPVDGLGARLLPSPGSGDRAFAVSMLEDAPVVLGDEQRIGTVQDVVVGLEEQRGFVVRLGERFGGRTVLLPVSETLVRDGRLLAAYTLNQLRALPTLDEVDAANLSPIAADETIRLRRSELDLDDVDATGSGRAYDPLD